MDLFNVFVLDGVYMYIYDNIDSYYEDLWLMFIVCNRFSVNVVMLLKYFYELFCNKNLFMFENGYFVFNLK